MCRDHQSRMEIYFYIVAAAWRTWQLRTKVHHNHVPYKKGSQAYEIYNICIYDISFREDTNRCDTFPGGLLLCINRPLLIDRLRNQSCAYFCAVLFLIPNPSIPILLAHHKCLQLNLLNIVNWKWVNKRALDERNEFIRNVTFWLPTWNNFK